MTSRAATLVTLRRVRTTLPRTTRESYTLLGGSWVLITTVISLLITYLGDLGGF